MKWIEAPREGFPVLAMGTCILIQLSWRLLKLQPGSELVLWYQKRTADAKGPRQPMIVAFARKLIIALWRYVHTGLLPEGFELKPTA